MTEIEEIVAKLSKAQRGALLEAAGGPTLWLTRWKHGRSVPKLYRLGLTYVPPPGQGGLIAIITPLGLKVRQYLQENEL